MALSALLLLRIPLVSWAEYLWPGAASWIEPVYEVMTYSLIVFLIWWERERLLDYHLDFWAILIILVFKPISVLLLPVFGNPAHPLAIPHIPGIVILITALAFLGLLIIKKINPGKRGRNGFWWFVFGSLAGIVLNILYGIVMIRWLNYPMPRDPGTVA